MKDGVVYDAKKLLADVRAKVADAKQKGKLRDHPAGFVGQSRESGWRNKLTRLVITTQFVLGGCFVAALIGLLGVPVVSGLE